MSRDSSYARRAGRLYALGADAAFATALAILVFSTAENAVFMTLASALGVVFAVKSFFAFQRARRVDEVHAVWMEMFEAPHRWRELALSRKAYAYAQQDDARRFVVAAGIAVIGAVGLVAMAVLTFASSVQTPASAWVWFVAALCTGSGGIVLWGIHHRRMLRMELAHVLGHREVRPPDMRLFPQRHSGGDAA